MQSSPSTRVQLRSTETRGTVEESDSTRGHIAARLPAPPLR